jgi:hypothetical protein
MIRLKAEGFQRRDFAQTFPAGHRRFFADACIAHRASADKFYINLSVI